jgi:hypothetical protein
MDDSTRTELGSDHQNEHCQHSLIVVTCVASFANALKKGAKDGSVEFGIKQTMRILNVHVVL